MTIRKAKTIGGLLLVITTILVLAIIITADFIFPNDRQFFEERYADSLNLYNTLFYCCYLITAFLLGLYFTGQLFRQERTWGYYAIISSIILTLLPIGTVVTIELMRKKTPYSIDPIKLIPATFVIFIFHLIICATAIYLVFKKIVPLIDNGSTLSRESN